MATTMISIHHAFQPLVCSLPYSSSSTISTSRSLLNSPNPHYKFISSVSKITKSKVKKLKWNALYADDDDEGYLVDAPVSVGDGFSFSGGKYSDMPSKADEWFKQGKIIKAYSVDRGTAKAKDPFFGLTMGEASQVQEDAFRWFYVEAGDPSSPSVVLIHGLPSQLTEQHAKLPSVLSSFTNFLLGEIFAQDPLRASDKLLTNCGPYLMDEEDAMVYRRPYLTSGSAGFALMSISRILKKELKRSIVEMRSLLSSEEWKVPTTIFWGMRDRWLNYNGVEEFVDSAKHKLIQFPKGFGMGNKELMEHFKDYKAIKAKQAYGPKGHRGMSVLIFEDSPVGYLEADRLQKHFLKEGKGRDDWNQRGGLTLPSGKRILYGYLATKEDMESFNKHFKGNTKVKYDMLTYKEKILEPVRKMNEDSQKLVWIENKVIEDRQRNENLEKTISEYAKRLELQEKEIKILMQRATEECKKGMDYMESSYKQQIDRLMEDNTRKQQISNNLKVVFLISLRT